jgi:hypothetical protein
VDRPAAVNLEWVANPEPDISSYTVEARAAGSSRWREVASVASTNAEHGGLGPGTEHVYRIKAVAADTLESAWSEEAPGRARPLPDAPSDVKVEWTADGAKLSWTPPRDGMSEFRIYEKGFFSSSKIQSAPGPDTVLGAGRVGKKIVVTVTAVDEEGLESSPSAPLEIRPPPAPYTAGLRRPREKPMHRAVQARGRPDRPRRVSFAPARGRSAQLSAEGARHQSAPSEVWRIRVLQNGGSP